MSKYTVTDINALKSAYPHLVKTVTKEVADRSKITAAIRAGFQLPGVNVDGVEQVAKAFDGPIPPKAA